MKKYLAAPSLDDVGKFKKEKAGVKIYTVKEGSIPDAGEGGRKTGLPVARIGEAIIKAPLDQVRRMGRAGGREGGRGGRSRRRWIR